MTKLDLEELLAPVSDSDRAGPDLAYDPQRHEIEQAFDASVSIDTDGSAASPVDIDWRRIIGAIVAQSARTKDVWLAVYLCRAGARSGRLDVVETGAVYIAGLMDRYWDDLHPRLDDYGVEGRVGACDTLATYREFIGPFRGITLIEHPRHGVFTAEDVIRFWQGGEGESGYSAFRATLDDAGSLDRLADAASHIAVIAATLRKVEATLATRAGAGAGSSFAPVFDMLAEIGNAVRTFLPAVGQPEGADDGEDAVGEGAPARERGVGGAVRSREDVVRTIDLVIDYYRRAEPHSPVPLLLGRAREWVNRDFMDVLSDIAPNAMSEAQHLLQFRGGAA